MIASKENQFNTKNVSIFFQVQGRGFSQCCSNGLHLNLITIHAPTKQILEDKLHNEKIKKNHSHLLVLDVLLLKPMQDLLLQPATKENKLSLKRL